MLHKTTSTPPNPASNPINLYSHRFRKLNMHFCSRKHARMVLNNYDTFGLISSGRERRGSLATAFHFPHTHTPRALARHYVAANAEIHISNDDACNTYSLM